MKISPKIKALKILHQLRDSYGEAETRAGYSKSEITRKKMEAEARENRATVQWIIEKIVEVEE